MSEIIEKLKEIKEEFQITALEISVACQATERSVWRWLHGNNSPSPQAVIEIEKFIIETRSTAEKERQKKVDNCKAKILDEIYNGIDYVFFSRPRPGERYSEGTYPTGVAQKNVSLKTLSKVCELQLAAPIILEALDNLSEQGSLKVISIFIPRRKLFEHLSLELEVAEAIRHIPAQDTVMEISRTYKDQPLSKEEIKINPRILKPGTAIKKMIEDRKRALKAQYGASGLEKEIELHHENLVEESRLRTAQLRAGNGKGDKKMEGDHYPASEYDTLPNERVKVREFFEEVVENNTDNPAIVYNCNHEKVEIPPHGKRIVLKARMIEKMPVEKEKVIK